jgi:hypothetical protein
LRSLIVISIWGLFEALASVGIYLFIGVFICLLSSSCFLWTLVVVHFFLCSAASLACLWLLCGMPPDGRICFKWEQECSDHQDNIWCHWVSSCIQFSEYSLCP